MVCVHWDGQAGEVSDCVEVTGYGWAAWFSGVAALRPNSSC